MIDFKPMNPFELALLQAQGGRLDVRSLLTQLAAARLAVPSATEVGSDWSGFRPLVFEKDGQQSLACFSDTSRVGDFAPKGTYCIVVDGHSLLRQVPAHMGLVVNPEWPVGFEMPAEGIAHLLQDLQADAKH